MVVDDMAECLGQWRRRAGSVSSRQAIDMESHRLARQECRIVTDAPAEPVVELRRREEDRRRRVDRSDDAMHALHERTHAHTLRETRLESQPWVRPHVAEVRLVEQFVRK